MVVIGAIAVVVIVIVVARWVVGTVIAVHAAPLVCDADEGGGKVVTFGGWAMASLMIKGCGAAPEKGFGVGEVGVFVKEVLNEWSEVAIVEMGVESAECFGFLGGVVVIDGGDEDSIEVANEGVNLESGDGVGVGAAKIVTIFACKIDSARGIDE